MSTAECTTESAALAIDAEPSKAEPGPAEKARKRLFVTFGGTVVFGLALSGWYVGDRIFAANTTASQVEADAVIEQPANIPLPVPPPVAFVIPVPPPPVLYLETVSLGDKPDLKFLKQLQLRGYAAKIENSSILIGPYAEHASLERARRKLAASGILAVESSR